jgi:fumarylpyruvate hydrolase
MPGVAVVRGRRAGSAAGCRVAFAFTTPTRSAIDYAFPVWDAPTVPVAGTADRFPVRHIYCVGRNYAEHAKEMGGDATKEPPFFFTKPADAVVPVVPPAVGRLHYPLATKNLHHEIELVAAIGARGVKVAPADALRLVWGYAVGLDMTRRDLQNEMREKKRPWDIGKSFAGAAPIGPIHPVAAIGHPARGRIWVDVNGTRRQQGDLADMIWDVAHTVHFLSQYYELLPGDLIFTGTPAGVGAVVAGDRLDGGIDGLGGLAISIDPAIA